MNKKIDNYIFCNKCECNPCECDEMNWEDEFESEINVGDEYLSELIHKVLGAGHYYSTIPVARGIVSVIKKQLKQFISTLLKKQEEQHQKELKGEFEKGIKRGKKEIIILADGCEKKGWSLDKFIKGLLLLDND